MQTESWTLRVDLRAMLRALGVTLALFLAPLAPTTLLSPTAAAQTNPAPIDFGNLTMWDGVGRWGKMQQKTDVFVWNGNLYAVTTCNWCGAAWSFWSQTDYPNKRPVVALEVVGIYVVDQRPCAKMGGSQIVWNGQMYQPHSTTPWPMIGADGIMGWIGWNASGWGGLKGVVTENLNPQTRHEDPYHLQYCGEVRCWTMCVPAEPPELMVVVNRVWIRG